MKSLVTFSAVFIITCRIFILHAAFNNEIISYADSILDIEAREKAVDVDYWQKRVLLKGRPARSRVYADMDREKIRALKKLAGEFKRLCIPDGCKDIQKKFSLSRKLRIDTLIKSVDYSKRLPLGGMCDTEYREVFGDWFNDRLNLESESYRYYKLAWAELAEKLPLGSRLPPFRLLDYEFGLYEANIKGWLAGQYCSEEAATYRIWYRYVNAVDAPEAVSKIQADFLNADSLKVQSVENKLPAPDRAELDRRARVLNENAWLELSRKIEAAYKHR